MLYPNQFHTLQWNSPGLYNGLAVGLRQNNRGITGFQCLLHPPFRLGHRPDFSYQAHFSKQNRVGIPDSVRNDWRSKLPPAPGPVPVPRSACLLPHSHKHHRFPDAVPFVFPALPSKGSPVIIRSYRRSPWHRETGLTHQRLHLDQKWSAAFHGAHHY